MTRTVWCLAFVGLILSTVALAADDLELPTVRDERPRLFLRAEEWDGPAVEKIRTWMDLPEYRTRARKLTGGAARYPSHKNRQALLWMLTDDEEAGRRALERFKATQIQGRTPSYWGISSVRSAAAYDWLRNHPGWDEESRAAKIAHLEEWGERSMNYLRRNPSTPFYSRQPGALVALTTIGLALHGDSPKADEMLRFAHDYLVNGMGTIRQAEDGATGGATYGLMHAFNDLACTVAAWRSATDWDAAEWIREHQGNWLERQMLYQIWHTYPNGWFVKDGDVWGGSHSDRTQFRMQMDIISGFYNHGPGRAHALQMAERWPNWDGNPSDYHTVHVWQFFVFNNPELEPAPLSELGRAEVFSPDLHGFVAWRNSWENDAAIVHFKCGETVDHHATWDQGRFTVFKHTPLAIKNGAYIGYNSPHHQYYKSPWSANNVVFTGPEYSGRQPRINFHGSKSWDEWKRERDRRFDRPPTGILLETEANDEYARALGDLSASVPGDTTWTRELVFLGYQYLIVLDRVNIDGERVDRHRWLLQTINEPRIDGGLVVADNEPGRLFARTLLPENAKLTKVGGPGREFDYDGTNRPPNREQFPPEMMMGSWRVEVEPEDGAGECTYLHVLFPTNTETEAMPECSVEHDDETITVKVGELEHVFRRERE